MTVAFRRSRLNAPGRRPGLEENPSMRQHHQRRWRLGLAVFARCGLPAAAAAQVRTYPPNATPGWSAPPAQTQATAQPTSPYAPVYNSPPPPPAYSNPYTVQRGAGGYLTGKANVISVAGQD